MRLTPAAACLAALLLAGCAALKENTEGRKAFVPIPDGVINSQAAAAYNQEKQGNVPSKDARLNAACQRVMRRLVVQADRFYPDLARGNSWEIVLFDKAEVNAWAMPGGKIAVYTGILPVCSNEAGLAAVIGHEIGHVLNKHGNERATQQLGVNAALIAGAYALSASNKYDGNVQQAIMVGAGAAGTVGFILPFSRKHEREADHCGTRLMAAAGYDPAEAPRLWQRMKDLSGGKAPPAFLSTHPTNEQRIADLNGMQAEAQSHYAQAPEKSGLGERF